MMARFPAVRSAAPFLFEGPPRFPIEEFHRSEALLVVVAGRFEVGVAGIVPAFPRLPREEDFPNQCRVAERAARCARIEKSVNARHRVFADIEETRADEALAQKRAEFDGETRPGLRRGTEKIFERIWDVVREALLVKVEEPLAILLQLGGADSQFDIRVFAEDAPLAFGEGEALHVDSERLHISDSEGRERLPVSVKNRSEVTPAGFPERVHLLRRLPPAHEVLVFDRLHVKNNARGGWIVERLRAGHGKRRAYSPSNGKGMEA